ncbi:MAG: hypothetical protein ACKOGJ_07255 [Phycisphaerales bacterium]
MAADRVGAASGAAGMAATVAVAWIAVTLWSTVLGAAYERLADANEPRQPPVAGGSA